MEHRSVASDGKGTTFRTIIENKTAQSLKTFRSLISFCVEAIKVSDEQLVTVAGYSGRLLNYYVSRKKRIPTESYWHASRKQFKDWILASADELAVALNTGTPLLPKSIKDRNWFEEECIDTVLSIFDHFAEKGALGVGTQMHRDIDLYCGERGG